MENKTEKRCSRCREIKPTNQFNNESTRKDGLSLYCKDCRRLATKEWKERKSQPGYKRQKKMREVNASPYSQGTLKNDIWVHMYRFDINLTEEEVERIICRLQKAASFWAEMDAIEAEYKCKVENYDAPILEILRQGREQENIMRDKYTGNLQQPVRMLTLEGEYIRSFATISDASEFICGHRSKLAGPIGNVCAGLTLSSGGYCWEFDTDVK